jgi:hypothetical protein
MGKGERRGHALTRAVDVHRAIEEAGRVKIRTRSFATAIALAVALAATAATPASAARDRCAVAGSKTTKQTSAVRVFSTTRKGTSVYYGCLRSTGRRVRLLSTFNDSQSLSSGSVRTVLIAGTSVTITSSGFDDFGVDGSEFESLAVADLTRGGRVYRNGLSTNDEDQYAGFAKVILRADGGAAWIVKGHGDYDEVDVLGAVAKRPTPVAYAKAINEKSLAFGGDGVTWVQGGATKTAAIP